MITSMQQDNSIMQGNILTGISHKTAPVRKKLPSDDVYLVTVSYTPVLVR